MNLDCILMDVESHPNGSSCILMDVQLDPNGHWIESMDGPAGGFLEGFPSPGALCMTHTSMGMSSAGSRPLGGSAQAESQPCAKSRRLEGVEGKMELQRSPQTRYRLAFSGCRFKTLSGTRLQKSESIGRV